MSVSPVFCGGHGVPLSSRGDGEKGDVRWGLVIGGQGLIFVYSWTAVEAFAFTLGAAQGMGRWKEAPWQQLPLQFEAWRDPPRSHCVTVCGGSCAVAKQQCCSFSFRGPGTTKLAGCLSAPLLSRLFGLRICRPMCELHQRAPMRIAVRRQQCVEAF